MTGSDRAVVLIAAGVIGALAARLWAPARIPEVLIIEAPGGQTTYRLGPDRSLRIPGHRGHSLIEVRGHEARFRDSPCRNRLCIRRGWLQEGGAVAACAPNGVLIRLEGTAIHGYDAISY